MLGIVVSEADSASVHIGEQLREIADWDRQVDDGRPAAAGGGTVWSRERATLRTFADLHLNLVRPARVFADPGTLVFASRHAGETGPLLTAHFTGNFGPAEHGGEPQALATACPNAHSAVLEALADAAPEGYDVGMEATHHGPTDVGSPSLFVEVGSGESEWRDPAAARAVARAILALEETDPHRPVEGSDPTADRFRRHVVGVGSGHYAPRFERIVRETDWAVGHVAPDWGLEAMPDPDTEAGRAILQRLFDASGAHYVLRDGEWPHVVATAESLGYRAVSETWLRETVGVPLALVETLETAVVPVAAGLRFGAPARAQPPDAIPDFETVPLPAALLDAALAIDQQQVRAAIEASVLAFQTDHGGTRLGGSVALPAGTPRSAIREPLRTVLAQEYDTVERRGADLVVTETAFDPGLAADAGVPEGPAFGKLSEGEPVTIDGSRIEPADVRREREEIFPLEDLAPGW